MLSLLPTHYSDHERNLELIGSAVCDRIFSSLWSGRLHDPMVCDARYLRTLGKYYGVEYWWQNISEEEHRNLIKNFKMIKRRRGTLWAVRQAINVIDPSAKVLEAGRVKKLDGAWKLDGGIKLGYADHWAKYILMLTRTISNAEALNLRNMLAQVAPVRSYLELLDFTAHAKKLDGSFKLNGNYNLGGA